MTDDRNAPAESVGGDAHAAADSPARIEPLATLPVFLNLRGRKVLVAGASDGAAWKAELLAAAGANVLVTAENCSGAFTHSLAKAATIHLAMRRWREEDFADAAFAIGDFSDDDEAAAFHSVARKHGVLVNVIDKPAFCDAQFGALVNRSPLVVAISTDGGAPVFAQSVRMRIEAVLPRGLQQWAQLAKSWRPLVAMRKLEFAARRRFWEVFAQAAFLRPHAAPARDTFQAFMDHLGRSPAPDGAGRVSLVGAGPGDPDLLTLKAVRALQNADVVLYDNLVSIEVLDLARREARRMPVGKKGHGPSCSQSEINQLMVSLARQGCHVVRLKGGDPSVFGRLNEEIEACRRADLPVEVIPGITTAQAAAAALNISLTERKLARRIQYLTGHGSNGCLPEGLNWGAIASPDVTTVVYMPVATLREFRDKCLKAGLPAHTPAAAIRSVSRPQEQRIISTISALPGELAGLPGDGPVIVIIGEVLRSIIVQDAPHLQPLVQTA